MDLQELYEKVSSKAEEEIEKLGFATILEAVGHRRNLFYQRLSEAVVGDDDVIPTVYLARILNNIGVSQGVGDAVAAINSTLEKNKSPVLIATIQEAVRMAFPEGFEIDIGNLNQEKLEGQKKANAMKASSTLLYRQQETLVKRIEAITCFPNIIRFKSGF